MAVPSWPAARPPAGFAEVWHREPVGLADLPGVRSSIRAFMSGDHAAGSPPADWVELLVLVTDEITSNALRHAVAPVCVALGTDSVSWLVTVTDHAAGAPPVPAIGRAPGSGGYGLYMIAELTSDHGWHTEDHHKTVWALLSLGSDGDLATT
jgi:anti-sigma regulatory factor (Ser/Thr protein kinase)